MCRKAWKPTHGRQASSRGGLKHAAADVLLAQWRAVSGGEHEIFVTRPLGFCRRSRSRRQERGPEGHARVPYVSWAAPSAPHVARGGPAGAALSRRAPGRRQRSAKASQTRSPWRRGTGRRSASARGRRSEEGCELGGAQGLHLVLVLIGTGVDRALLVAGRQGHAEGRVRADQALGDAPRAMQARSGREDAPHRRVGQIDGLRFQRQGRRRDPSFSAYAGALLDGDPAALLGRVAEPARRRQRRRRA